MSLKELPLTDEKLPWSLRQVMRFGGRNLLNYINSVLIAQHENIEDTARRASFRVGRVEERAAILKAQLPLILRADYDSGRLIQEQGICDATNNLQVNIRRWAESLGISIGQVVSGLRAPEELRAGDRTIYDPSIYDVHPFHDGRSIVDGDTCLIVSAIVTDRRFARPELVLRGIVAPETMSLNDVEFIHPQIDFSSLNLQL